MHSCKLKPSFFFASLLLTVPSNGHGLVASELCKRQQRHHNPKARRSLLLFQKPPDATFFGNSEEIQQILADGMIQPKELPIPVGPSFLPSFASTLRYRGGLCEEIVTPAQPSESFWQTTSSRLVKLANLASLLCVIHCTVLPIVTILFPLLGMAYIQ